MSSLQIFDALDSATEAALRASIAKHGVIMPVIVDQDDRIIDGHHRVRIADDLGKSYKTITHWVAGDFHAKELARTLNEDRRQLPLEERREAVADLRQAGHSQRAIAGALRVPRRTVRDDLAQVGGSAQVSDSGYLPPVAPASPDLRVVSEPTSPMGDTSDSQVLSIDTKLVSTDTTPERVKGTDGKSYPARKPEPSPEQARIDGYGRLTKGFAQGLVGVYSTLRGDPTAPLTYWIPSQNPCSSNPGVDHLGTPAGIREVAELLLDLADHLDANQPEGLPWS